MTESSAGDLCLFSYPVLGLDIVFLGFSYGFLGGSGGWYYAIPGISGVFLVQIVDFGVYNVNLFHAVLLTFSAMFCFFLLDSLTVS